MKKTFVVSLLSVILLAGCGSKEETVKLSDSKFDIDICNQYFELADCILEKDPNEDISAEDREQYRKEFLQYQEELKNLDSERLTTICESNYNKLISDEKALIDMGCYFE